MALNNLNNLQQRLIAGVIGGALMIGLIWYGVWSYMLLFFLIYFLSIREFYQLIRSADFPVNAFFGMVAGSLLFCAFFIIENGWISTKFYYVFFPMLFLLFIVELYRLKEKPFHSIAFTYLGVFYIALPLALLHTVALKTGVYNYRLILGIILILWANDVGAYFFGRTFGKHKLFFRISPKKTWEGTLGGGLVAILLAGGLAFSFNETQMHVWFVVATIIVVFGSFGDLVESMLKRSLNVKDSAQAIPGHGGFLDRFDGLFLSAPFIAAYIQIFE